MVPVTSLIAVTLLFISMSIQSQGSTPHPNTMVRCRTDRSCGGSSVASTFRDCCDHDIEPSGFAYTIPGVGGCQLCPVDFGFNQSSFSGVEGESYRVQVKFFSGGITGNGFTFLPYLELTGIAGNNDIHLITTRGRFLPSNVLEPKNVEFLLSVDYISQEPNETFVLRLQISNTSQFGMDANIRDRLEGVVIDSDVITFQLSQEEYIQNEEPNAVIEVLIIKGSSIQLANPVYFRVTPLTVNDALTRSIISYEFEQENPDNSFSPNRANYEDFNNSVLYVEFPTDRDSVEVAIPIVDDDIDEADEQVFIIFLEVVNATNVNIMESKETSIGRIRDDEIIRIGFEHQSYEDTEPTEAEELITNLVYLIREDNRKSEQTYSVDLTVGDPGGNTKPATIETSNTNQSFDYSFGLVDQTRLNVLFPPTVDRIPFVFSLNPDLAVEGTETFRATSAQRTPSGDFPVFQTPGGVTAFATTLIHILDNGELRVGFEELNYTISESAGTVEVCVIVISPPPDADLDVTVALSPSTINGTAGAGSDFTGLTPFLSVSLVIQSSKGSPTAGPRRECFDVTITNDDLLENTESFSLLLQEDTFGSQTGAIISPDQAAIFIFDDNKVVIGFLSKSYSVVESDGTVSIRFGVITRSLRTTISVQLSFSAGSALSGSDYNAAARVYSLTGRETVTVNIGIIEDNVFELTEVFYASLSFTSVYSNVTIAPNRTEIVISDDGRLIQSQRPTPNPTAMVECRPDRYCGGSPITSTFRDCCNHDIFPSGFAYTLPNVEDCFLCPVDFGFSQSSFSGIEQGEYYRLQVKFFSGGIGDGFIFHLSVDLSGTTSNNDIHLVTTWGRFLPSDVLEPKNVEFSLSVDNIAQESNETFVLRLQISNTTSQFGMDANIRDRLEGVIIDSDEISFQLSQDEYTKNEEPNAVMEVLIIKGNSIQLANPVYFRVTPLTVGDALARGVISQFEAENPFSPNRANYEDFNDSVLYVEFPTDRDTVEVTISIVDDDIDEADEQVFIIFLEAVNSTSLHKVTIGPSGSSSIGRIRDDEIIRIGFERPSYEVTEPNPEDENVIHNLVYLIRENSRKSEQTYSVDLTVGDPGGNTNPAIIETFDNIGNYDYSFGFPEQTKQNIRFPPTVDRISFVFSLNPDLSVEETEIFQATSAQVTPSGPYPVFQTPAGVTAFATTLIHILDNDELIVGFEELNYTVSESAGTVEVCIIVTSPPPTEDLDFTVALSPSTTNGTAGAGSDFTGLTPSLSISLVIPSSKGSPTSGPRRVCFDVSITDDNLLETTEYFSLLLQEDRFESQTGAIINPDRAYIFILDQDDAVTIGFDHDKYSFNESDGLVHISASVMQGGLGRPVELQFNTMSGTATSEDPKDFESLQNVVLQHDNVISFSIIIINDNILEGRENFFALLTTSDPDVNLGIRNTTISIVDDGNEVTFGFEPVHYSVDEDAGTVTLFVVLLDGSLEREVNLHFSTVEGTAMASVPADYRTDTRTITFSSTISSVSIPVVIYNDNILESTENFLGNLRNPQSQIGFSIMPNIANVAIIGVTIGFERTTYLVSEGNVVDVCVVLTGTLRRTLDVFVNSSSGSATVAEDYNPVLETLTFGPTSNRACFNFTTLKDEILEEDIEDLNLQLTTMALNSILNPFLAQVHILDDEICPIGSYLARTSPGNTVCQPCPDNSVSIMPDSAVCECYQGYRRSSLEAIHLPCTRPPSACRNLRVLQKRTRANTITVRWERPLITGRDDYYYDIFYSDPDLPGRFKKHNLNAFIKHYPLVTYSVSGLRPLTGYTIRVVSQNGVSDQDPHGEDGRRCEVSETTGDISAQPPRSVTSFCSVIVWKAPTLAYGVITGYDVSLSPPGEDNGVIVSNNRDELFHVVRASELPPRQGDILVKVRAKTVSHNGTWSEAIPLNCTGIDGG